MKDIIKSKSGLNVLISHKGVSQLSRIFCDEIEYMHDRGKFQGSPIFDHHLMFRENKNLVFKVWLRNDPKDKEYKDIYEALKVVGIKVIEDSP